MYSAANADARRTGFLLLAIVVAGTAIRLWQLGDPSLWLDEAATLKFARLPWSTLWISGYDNAPPLYYSLVKLVLLFGDSEFLVRLPAAVFGILTIPVLYGAAAMVGGPRAGLVAALFAALSTTQVEYSQEARSYSLLMFAQSVALLGLLQVLLSGRTDGYPQAHDRLQARRGILLYGAGILVALYSHNIAVFFVFVTQLVFFVHVAVRRFRPWGLPLTWLVVNAAVLLAWSPWLLVVLTELLGNGSMDWLPQPGFVSALMMLRDVHGANLVWAGRAVFDVVLLVALAVAVWRTRGHPMVAGLLLAVAFVGPLLIWLIGFSQPLYMPRTVVWAFAGIAVLVGIGIAGLARPLRLLALAIMIAWLGRSAWVYFALGQLKSEDWRHAFETWESFDSAAGERRLLLFCSAEAIVPFLYYARHRDDLPEIAVWGFDGSRYGARLLGAGEYASGGHEGWADAVPADTFRWQRGAVDANRKPMPFSAEFDVRLKDHWNSVDLVVSHCPDDAREAALQRLAQSGWRDVRVTPFDGGELQRHERIVDGAR